MAKAPVIHNPVREAVDVDRLRDENARAEAHLVSFDSSALISSGFKDSSSIGPL